MAPIRTYVFADIISRHGRHCINMTGGRQLVNGVTSTWLSCFAMCDWLRALAHLHCDIMITTWRSKHGDLADRCPLVGAGTSVLGPDKPTPSPSPITCWLALRARASQMTMCRFTWRVSLSPRHRCVRCIMTSLATTVKSHENTPNIEFSYASLGVWNDGNSRNQTLTICRLFQSCISNYSQQEKLEYSEYIFVTFTKFLLWVNLWYFGVWIRLAPRPKCGRQTMRIQIRSHCYSSNLGDYIKTHGLISIKLW